MRARVVALREVTGSDIERWTELSRNAIEPNPFLDPFFLASAARHRDDADSTQLLLVEDGGELMALMAFAIVKRDVRGVPITAITTGTPLLISESERWHPLVHSARPVEALEALLRGMTALRLPSYLDLERMPADGPLAEALFAAAASSRMPVVERGGQEYGYVLRESEPKPAAISFAAHEVTLRLDYLSQRTRRRYSHSLRDLRQHLGGDLTLTNRGDDPEAMDEFFALQAAGWKGDTSRGGGAFRITGYEPWFREVATSFRSEGRLSVFVLAAGSETLYCSVNLHSGSGLFGVHDAFNEKFAEYSPGGLGRLAVIAQSLAGTRADFFDPSMHPKYVESTHLFPHRRRLVSLLIAQRGLLPKALVGSIPALRRLRDLPRSGADDHGPKAVRA